MESDSTLGRKAVSESESEVTVRAIRIRIEVDTDPELSWIGKYSQTPEAGAIDRQERGDQKRNEYRYFNPANPEYAEEEYKHMEAYERSEWCMVGIWAEAELVSNNTIQKLRSGGLWGIESNSDIGFLKDTA